MLKGKIGRTIKEIRVDKEFMSRNMNTHIIIPKVNKWDFMKGKSFWRVNKTSDRVKRLCKEWEKIFANYSWKD